ncbi:831_t:CDS:2 [Ambispora gerdemannii]|uniref:831_t:CDS:1 n=1 Tax=Ambispora gerdemannii TaxID=144530 RepID=A0A9N8ZCE9_9GLOM|nr:831_t:CDS:2 [Ambispora gerdemannii]
MNHENTDEEDIHIALNVGGMKYETYYSTLLKYPTSYLAKFIEKEDPDDKDEYFIDRDGQLFWYVLEFYRNGTIVFQDPDKMCVTCGRVATRELLKEEFEFYEIPFTVTEAADKSNLANAVTNNALSSSGQKDHYVMEKAIAAKLDEFMYCLKEVFAKMVINFEKQVQIIFFGRKTHPTVKTLSMSDHPSSYLVRTISDLVIPYGSVAAKFLESFEYDIYAYLRSECYGFEWKLQKDMSEEIGTWIIVTIMDEGNINRTEIMEKSCLKGGNLKS